MEAGWRIELLGGLRVQHGDRVITRFPTQKTGVLLAYLAYYHQHPHPRDALIEQLWPDIDLDAARSSLRSALYSLRQLLEPTCSDGPLLIATRSTLSLSPAAFTTDVAEFEAALHAAARSDHPTERAARLSDAVERYRGELLPGYYETWILQERQHLAEAHLGALHQLVTALEHAGELEQALEVARRAVSSDPLREEAHFDLMRLYAAAGQPSAVLRQYQELERLLSQELGEPPSAAARVLADELRQRAHQAACNQAGQRPAAPSARLQAPGSDEAERLAASRPGTWSRESGAAAPPPFHRNLPVQLTRFIGRARELAEVQELLASTRLLTLTGTGGCGKTRLALEVAAELPEETGEGIWLVELAPLSDPDLVPQAVATALEAGEERFDRAAVSDGGRAPGAEPEKPLTQTLVERLKSRRLLLLLDNCEHLLVACAQLVETLLGHCPQVRILATSREGLGLLGEQTYRVPSLPLPDPRRLPSLEQLQEFEAVKLFADRAALSDPSFAVTHTNAGAVVQICHRLDGMPLAIELAAARLRVMPVDQIAARLDDRFRLLTGGSRTALPRQQTLRATLDWSYDLLSEAERSLLRRLSVFVGGFTLEAAEAVCTVGARQASSFRQSWNVLDLLLGLVEKSLVGYEPQRGEARYWLLETVRQYGRERLVESGEEAAAQERHLAYFLEWAEGMERELGGGQQADWYERVEREHDNLRAALEWCRAAPGCAEAGLRLGGALWRFWELRRYAAEGRSHLDYLLSRPEAAARTAPRAKALQGAGCLAYVQGDEEAAPMLLGECLEIRRELGDHRGAADVLTTLGGIAIGHRRHEESRRLHEEALAIYRQLGDAQGIAEAVFSLGAGAWSRHDYPTARALLKEALTINRTLGDRLQEERILGILGMAAFDEAEFVAARSYFEESLAIARAFGERGAAAVSLFFLGRIAFHQRDYGAAGTHWEACRAIDHETGNKGGSVLGALAHLAAMEGDFEEARALWEQSLAEARELRSPERSARALRGLADVARRQGDAARACSLYAQSLEIARGLEDPQEVVMGLEEWAALWMRQGDAERAARLFGAAETLRNACDGPLPPDEMMEEDRWVAEARAALDPERFAAAWAAGRAMGVDQAVEEALGRAGPPGNA